MEWYQTGMFFLSKHTYVHSVKYAQSELAVRTSCTIVRVAQSNDYAKPSVAQRKHRASGEFPSLAQVNVNKVAIFNLIVWNGIN